MALGRLQRQALARLVVDRTVSLPTLGSREAEAFDKLCEKGLAVRRPVRGFFRYRPTMEGARALVLELAARLEA